MERRRTMSKKILETLTISTEDMEKLNKRAENLAAKGVHVTGDHSGELNFAGCASGYCQAWD
jgi:mevalonate kinase